MVKIFHYSLKHHPVLSQAELPTRLCCNKPEERHSLIINHLKENSEQFSFEWNEIKEVSPSAWQSAALVHSERFVQFMQNAHNDFLNLEWSDCEISENGTKKGPLARLIPYHICIRDGEAEPGPNVQTQVAFYAGDRETPIGSDTAPSLACDLTLIEASVTAMLKIDAAAASPTERIFYCANVHPGHHAYLERYSGFCFINQAVVACALLLQHKQRIVHIDLDYHHGNGSAALHRRRAYYGNNSMDTKLTPAAEQQTPPVFFVSLHMDPTYDYPDNSGYAHNSTDHIINVPLDRGTTGDVYASALQKVMTRAQRHQPDVVVISLGTDSLKNDPCGKAGMSLSPADYKVLGNIIIDALPMPVLVVQEGGYNLEDSPDAVCQLLLGLAQQ